ncbi:hypothetical protein HQ393_06975 [Chitinibacter bivalviorum]|uniref:Uncharacterized protein n=1 Tax=Chitinibacter bivalviorum TaxID=2739434 RepID=A0A7H9BH25_9NEIS|nr:hypothetical protein [Chitinibacter bivalviorum]QLG88023.1 hypothetical protein HQ393_06975 [Chitinibacter bivalviorum]
MTIIEAITFAIAILGAALGLINTWHNLDKARVKLIVQPKHAVAFGGADENLNFCIEITNLSSFPVTLSETGVLYHGTMSRGVIIQPVLLDGGPWPRRLEPRSSVSIYAQNPAKNSERLIRCAYAKTACGVTKRATSPALKQLATHGL